MECGGDVWAYRPPLCLWRLVEQHVSVEEQDEIRSMLGTSLIETTLDLHHEIEILLEIWRDYQDDTEAENPRTQTLAEPPHVRERLVKEICFLAEGVREKSLRKGMNPCALFSGHNSHILEYAEEAQRSGSSLGRSRPMSARSVDGRQTPISPSELATSRSMLSDTIHDDVSSSAHKLNYMQFDQVCSRLRETLNKEVEQLEADVIFLQGCLDMAADTRSHTASPLLSREPTLTELREERSMLEKELLSAETLPSTPSVAKPSFLAKPATPSSKLQNLAPMKCRLRPAVPTSADRTAAKTAPLKASHPVHPPPPSDRPFPSPDLTTPSPDSAGGSCSHSINRVTAQTYDLSLDLGGPDPNPHPPPSADSDSGTASREGSVRRRSGSGSGRRRSVSPARVKVVPVGSLLGGGTFIPAPPSAEKPSLPRPGSAERFRKMVMHSRETS